MIYMILRSAIRNFNVVPQSEDVVVLLGGPSDDKIYNP